ncbi:hypothetical protein FRB99_008330 [Tulasnella sp. 403]|nr:hypothetical protein FRB99_008330 [Tulasnella sp. 403]
MSLYPTTENYSPDMSVRAPSPQDTRSKNARAQARHRAKRKAYVETLENTVHQLRAALSSTGSSPESAMQIQYLEQENARLRAESQSLRAQLGTITNGAAAAAAAAAGVGVSSPSSSMSYAPQPPSHHSSAYGGTDASLRLPSVSDAMGLSRSSSSSMYGQQQQQQHHSSYLADDAANARGRYYESTVDYRRRVSQPYGLPPATSTTGTTRRDNSGGYDKGMSGYESERLSGSTSRSSQRSSFQSPTTSEPTNTPSTAYYSSSLYNGSTPSFPPASSTAGAYVFNNPAQEETKPYV